MQLPEGVKLTPMLKQYGEWKDKYPDCLLLFRMGDFFELFFEDAVTASEVLDITLTARDQDKAIPMAGVPHHALDTYLGRLIAAGYKVAVCDQITEPDGKTLVERKVVRVVTPGTHVPPEEGSDGKLAAILPNGETSSLALLSVGTGSLDVGTLGTTEAVAMLLSFAPGELLFPRGREDEVSSLISEWLLSARSRPILAARDRSEFSIPFASGWLCKKWGIASLRAMGLEDTDPATGAAAVVLRYLEETQFGGSGHVNGIRPILPEGTLIVDHATQINLELIDAEGMSLFDVLNKCRTPMGKRLLRDWITRPLLDLEKIAFRQDCIETFVSDHAPARQLAETLSRCRDIDRALGRLSLRVGSPKDLAAVRDTLQVLPQITELVGRFTSPALSRIANDMPDLQDLDMLLSRALSDDPPRLLSSGGIIRDGFDETLDGARDAIRNAEEHLKTFEQDERERTGIKLRVGVNKVFGYYIEISKSNLANVPDDYIRRQTVAGGERFVNERLKDIERRAFRAEHEIGEREDLLYKQILGKTLECSRECQVASRAIAQLDVLRSLAEVARDNNYCRPMMDESRTFTFKAGRHPVVERALGTVPFTPNDLSLDPDGTDSIAILTGPNMAGKSTYLRMAALIALMAHMGSFIPAESATIGLVDRVFTRIGARDELARGRSTFMVEMVETANILRNVTPRSLVVLDEIGRGTSTYDGMSIAWAVVEFLSLHVEGRTKALFATHYHELTNMSLPCLVNLSMAVEELADGVRFLHKVVPGPADRSYGVEVARLAGVPNLVIKRSQELLSEFEEKSKLEEHLEELSRKYAQKEIFFDVEREGVIEQLAACDPNQMTPMEALDLIYTLRKKSRNILGMNDDRTKREKG